MWNTLSQTRYYRENGLFPATMESNAYIKRMFGPVIAPKAVPARYVHPQEARLISLIRSRRSSMHFLRDQLTYNLDAAGDPRFVEKCEWYIHCHAVAICNMCDCIRRIRSCVAWGVTVPDFSTVR